MARAELLETKSQLSVASTHGKNARNPFMIFIAVGRPVIGTF